MENKEKVKKEEILQLSCFREMKGITLIALVVTIIVLLILAGVTISALSGENGILNKAKRSKEVTSEASAKEEVEVAYQGILINVNDGTITEDQIAIELEKELNVPVIKNGSNYDLNYKGYDITISQSTGIVSISTNEAKSEQKIQWIYHENSDGNIEITGMDLKECSASNSLDKVYGDFYKYTISLGTSRVVVPSYIDGKKVVRFDINVMIFPDGSGNSYIGRGGVVNDLREVVFNNVVEEISLGGYDFINLTLNFNNGKSSELQIPSDKWGADKILINGTEWENPVSPY